MTPEMKAKEYLDRHWDKQFPVNPIDIAMKEGLKVYAGSELGADGTSGQYLQDEDGSYAIFFNPLESKARQRFTIAHELGHHAFSHGAANRDQNIFTIRDYNIREVVANRFAAELLMPENYVRAAVHKDYNLAGLVALFGVSESAMRIRLSNLNLFL